MKKRLIYNGIGKILTALAIMFFIGSGMCALCKGDSEEEKEVKAYNEKRQYLQEQGYDVFSDGENIKVIK